MKFEYWFANVKGIGNQRKREIRQRISSAKELFYMEEKALRSLGCNEKEIQALKKSSKNWKVEEQYQELTQSGVQFFTSGDTRYPKKLQQIASAPYAIYVKGKLPEEEGTSVAIVGARQCSLYGEEMAKWFAKELAQEGIQIISGMARGIDGISQRWAMEYGGTTFGVLGSGVDVCYPREHYALYQDVIRNGGLLSEQPIGTKPYAQNFPARNRIISALSDAILVIEARGKSGSLITADMALEQGKDVYAMPGPVQSDLSRGCHELIRQGAGILLSPEELLEDLGIFRKSNKKKEEEKKIVLERTEKLVYSCLDFQPKSLVELSGQVDMQIPELIQSLMGLEEKRLAKEISQNFYIKVK